MSKKAVSLVEILVASFILASVFAGLLASFIAVRKYVTRANSRLVGVNMARGVLGSLYPYVRADTWDSAGLNDGNTTAIPATTVDGGNYAGNYTVSNVSGHTYREVTINITYQ